MSDQTEAPVASITQSADPVIATTPEPITESWESQISRQLKNKPNIPKTDLKSLESLPDDVAVDVFDSVSVQEASDFLKNMDGKDVEPKKEKKIKVEVEPEVSNSFDVSDLDLSKDPDPIEEKPKKKSKEDNIAELRKKAESYEETLKTKDTELSTYRDKLEKMEAELERTAFEKSPKFLEKYQDPYNASVTSAVEFATEYAADDSIVEKALSLKGRERIDFIDDSFGGGAAAAQFLSLINNAD
ncbi:MAG: hypothetical protein AN484_06700, partial [Aphanizomenon flos-aquae WA102]